MKQCSRCKEIKPRTEFYKNGKTPDGLRSHCKECNRKLNKDYYERNKEKEIERGRKWAKENPESKKKIYRRQNLKRNYGITLEEYEDLLRQQGGRCAICKSADPVHTTNFAVDHCHDTGVVRGLLCMNCNQGLGKFKDSKEILSRAIEYLGEFDG